MRSSPNEQIVTQAERGELQAARANVRSCTKTAVTVPPLLRFSLRAG